MRIVFMGTPDFARTILERLVADRARRVRRFHAAGQAAQPKQSHAKPCKGICFVAEYSRFSAGDDARRGTALEDFKTLAPELAVVAAYGRILPEEMLAVPVHGCINAHASILPKYRGARRLPAPS